MNDDREPTVEPTIDNVPRIGPRSAGDARASVVCVRGPGVGRTVPIGQAVLFGRHADATVQVNDSSVSRRHARLSRTGAGEYHLVDLDSRNGTLVNGRPITASRLDAGDLIQIGEHAVFRFVYRDPMEQQLLESQKMEAVGRMAGGIAHDFNNLLTVIASSAHLIREELDDPGMDRELARELVDDMIDAYERAAELTRRLLDFARRGDDDWEPLSINKLITRMTRLASRSMGPAIAIELDLEERLRVRGSRPRLGQVILNLCVNAADAMPDGGVLRVEARKVELDPLAVARVDLRLEPGKYVRIRVKDSGSGIDPTDLPRIFEPFYTTKDVGKGTGLGLAMVYGIVRRHGGHIRVDSTVGQGTTMTIHLPVLQVTASNTIPTAQFQHKMPEPVTPGLALIVDDEPAVCRATARMLQRSGWKTQVAASGSEGLHWLTDNTADLVVLDCVMPGLSGLETLSRLRALAPDVPVLMHSGTNDVGTEQALAAGASGFLHKPYSHTDLLEAIRVMRANPWIPNQY